MQSRAPLPDQSFDVIVIGGGVNGVAIARECGRAGRRVLLLEQNDFGSGTSSRSTRIIHGGLRYLEHGEIGLVRESLRERERLLRERAHLVRPMRFLLALPREHHTFSLRNSFSVRAGLWLYGALAGHKHCQPAATAQEFEKCLDSGDQWSVFDYEDAQCEFPERLIAEWAIEAAAAGAVMRNHAEVLEVEVASGRATGVRARDVFTGAEARYTAPYIVNATGPWVDRVCAASSLSGKRLIGGVRGSHILMPLFSGAPDCAVYSEGPDGRPMFVIPWNGQLLVGTTEVADDGDPDNATPTSKEIEYLVNCVQRLYPQAGISSANVTACFAGIRPLPYAPGVKANDVSRHHILHDHAHDGAAGLISVIGGKLTTAASLARQCARKLGVNVPQPALPMIAKGSASGLESTLQQWSRQIAQVSRHRGKVISQQSARAIAEWHGPRALSVIFAAAQDARSAERLCPHTEHLVAEALHAIRAEQASTLGDVLLRRVPVALSGCWDENCSRHAAARIANALGWSASTTEAALLDLEEERSRFMRRPESLGSGAGSVMAPAQHVA